MDREQESLQQISRMARAGQKFFAAATPIVKDAEIRSAFEYIEEVKSRLVADLSRFTNTAQDEAVEHVSAAVTMEKMYTDLERTFRRDGAEASARLLALGEEQLLRAVERTFESTQNGELKEILKTYYSQLIICREAMSRLRAREAA